VSSGAIDGAARAGTGPGMDPGVDHAAADTIAAVLPTLDARVITADLVAGDVVVDVRGSRHWRLLLSLV
jgi:hypothetical protein